MQKFILTSLMALSILTACRSNEVIATSTGIPASEPTVKALDPTVSLAPTNSPPPVPSATIDLPTVQPHTTLQAESFSLRIHPDGPLYAGDQISFEVIAPESADLSEQKVFIDLVGGDELGSAGFGGFGIGERQQATLQWAWDTTAYDAGAYQITFSIRPEGPVFTETVALLPSDLVDFPEPDARWDYAESDCCLIYYVTGTEAERDLDFLMQLADQEADLALRQLEGELTEPITIVFLPRVLGHGGFAGGEIYISYLDRNYAGNDPGQVIHHEIIHILDGRKGGEYRPSIFVEGLAVLLSGGHFKKEPIIPRAAAVVESGTYIALGELTNDFYFAQHEVSYLQGAALIQFMVDRWGWEAFDGFYRSIESPESNLQSEAINAALLINFGITFEQLERDFLAYLEMQPIDPAARLDIQLSVRFFDTVRRYQQLLDTSAYFLSAWLIGIEPMIEANIVTDYLRHPEAPENLAIETLLVTADRELRRGDYTAAANTLAVINLVLERLETGDSEAFYADPVATDYFAIVLALLDLELNPQIIEASNDSAVAYVTNNSVELVEINFVRDLGGWLIPDS